MMNAVDIVKADPGLCTRPFGAMNTIAELKLMPLWVDPRHLVSTAIHIMAGHKVKALGVLQEGKLLGTVSLETLAAAPQDELVGPFLHPLEYVVQAGAPIRSVASLFVEEGLEYAPVMDGDKFMGIVTPLHLLRELGRSYDPLTGLSWSDRLRDWGLEHLKNGDEVTIIFVDLDDFGDYNKKYGHIVGDRVLQLVARYLSEQIDPISDILVRYGGDEFAVGTLRYREDTEKLAEAIESGIGDYSMLDVQGPVQFSIGIYGGRRTRERDNVHYAATLDNLINMSSKDCLANKTRKKTKSIAQPEPASDIPTRPAFTVAGVYFDERATNGVTTVILSEGETVVSGAHSRAGRPALESIAIATCKAMERAYPGTSLTIEDIRLSDDSGRRLITISGIAVCRGIERAVSDVIEAGGDLYQAVAEATVGAMQSAILSD